ncbi:MAG: anti-sigma factor [Pirellulaceae bacterium]
MNCSETQDNAVPYLLEELGGDFVSELEQHLAKCGKCRAELEELRFGVQTVTDRLMGDHFVSADQSAGSDTTSNNDSATRILESVMERVREDAASTGEIQISAARSSRLPWPNANTRTVLISCITFAAGVLLMLSVRSLWPLPASGTDAMAKQEQFADPNPSASGQVSLPETGSVRLTTIDNSFQGEGVLQLLYDFASGELHVYCENLKDPPEGQSYVLVCESTDGNALGSPASARSDSRAKSRQLCRVVPDETGFAQTVVPRLSRDEANTARVVLLADTQVHEEL